MSILLACWYSEPVLVLFLDYSKHKVHLLQLYSRILKVFYVLRGNFKWFFFSITVCDIYIHCDTVNGNSCSRNVNVMYGVFVITALK